MYVYNGISRRILTQHCVVRIIGGKAALTFGRRVAEFLVAVQRPGKVFVHHGGHVAGIMGEHHAIDGHVLRVRRGYTPVPRSRVVRVVIVLVHFGADVCGGKRGKEHSTR